MEQTDLLGEMLYRAAASLGKSLVEKGLLTPEEYAEIDTILIKKYRPYLCGLCSDSACFSPSSERYIDVRKGEETGENSQENRTDSAGTDGEKTGGGIRQGLR